MIARRNPGRRLMALLALMLSTLLMPAFSSAVPSEPDTAIEESDEQDPGNPEAVIPAFNYSHGYAGYRFVDKIETAAAADPYTRFKSGVAGGASIGTIGSDLKLAVDAVFVNEDDYHAELLMDYRGVYRLHLESQALWHNLLTEQLPPGAAGTYSTTDLSPGAIFGLRTALTQVEGRIRPGKHPFHLGLGYWQMEREGTVQSIFSDHYFGDAQSRVISTGKRTEQVIREGTAAVDGFFGYFGLSYVFRIRDFSNDAPDTRYDFKRPAGGTLIPANQAVNVVSDSQLTSHTIKVYTDLSGGLVGSGAYTLTMRENMADRGDARPSSRPRDAQQFLSGDLSYTPLKEMAFTLKYRRLDTTRESPSTISYPYAGIPTAGTIPGVITATQGLLLVRPSIETVTDTLSVTTTYRPVPAASFNLEYRAELESRDNVPDPATPGNPAAIHGDRRQTHTGKAGFSWRPYKGLKLNGSYSYAACDNPAYTASFSGRHNVQLFIGYTADGTWGANASFIGRYDNSEDLSSIGLTLPRKSRNNSANAGFWFSPLQRLVLSANYSYLLADTDQAVLFSQSAGSLAATNYRSEAHVYGIDATYAFSEMIDFSLAFQQTASSSRFAVPPVQDAALSTDGITALTSLDSIETGVSARAGWQITPNIGCSLDYRFRMYDAGNPLFDGQVHATLLSLTARW